MTMIVGDGCDNDDDVENGMIVVTVMNDYSIDKNEADNVG